MSGHRTAELRADDLGRPAASGNQSAARPDPREAINALEMRLSSAERLLAFHSRLRSALNEIEFKHLTANELRKLIGARQVIVLQRRRNGFQVAAISSVSIVDRTTPFVIWLERLAKQVAREFDSETCSAFEADAYPAGKPDVVKSYPFRHLIWIPVVDATGQCFGAVLCARETPWRQEEQELLEAEKSTIGTNWIATLKGAVRKSSPTWRKLLGWLSIPVLLAALAIPVPMTTLAPFEIVAKAPQHVTAPLDAVVKNVLVPPNHPVSAGDPIVQYDDTTLRNQLQVAEQNVALATARYNLAQQNAFRDPTARREVMIALAELRLKAADRDSAKEQLSKTVVRATRNGIAIYSDRDELVGRPVKVGQRLLDIADPASLAVRIEVPVADAIVIDKADAVRLFLNSAPLDTVRAHVVTVGYHAEPNSTQQLVYPLKAEFDKHMPGLRIGDRGTAQLVGDPVPLVFFLLRRPISSARQYLGL